MIGLLRPPAVILLLARESTPVRLATAVGHRFERTSRVTCCEARAVNRATEINGLLLSASASASFSDKLVRFVVVGGAKNWGPFGVVWLEPACGVGAEGKLCVGKLNDAWAW